MVKTTFFIVLSAFFLSLSSGGVAGEFTASVSSTQVHLSERFTLNLTLTNTSPKEAPVVSSLKKHFSIHSQQHSTNTTVVNGQLSSSITWWLSLTPKIDGVVQIPAVTVNTAEGLLSTQPISLNVIKGSSQSSVDNVGPNLISKVSNASPYKNEPFLYTASLTSKLPLYNIQAQKMQVQDAIVELVDEPKLKERVVSGVLVNFVEYTYLITPLKTGTLTIAPLAIQGAIPQKGTGKQSSSFFNHDIDPFAMLQGFDRLKPFILTTEEIHLDVLPPISEVSPWLPAKTLTLEEQWPSDQTLRVGEPFARSFLIKAEGLKASQLPHLENIQSQSSTLKVYADKPEEQEKVFQGIIHSMRKEQYTLIPQQAGTWVLPEISINWWDSAKKEKRSSTIPARMVQILPALETATSSNPEVASTPFTTSAIEAPLSSVPPPFLLYGVIGILTVFLIAALLWGYTLQRKIASLTTTVSQKPVKPPVAAITVIQKENKEKLPDLNPT